MSQRAHFVRALGHRLSEEFHRLGYVGIGWLKEHDFSKLTDDDIRRCLENEQPEKSRNSIDQQVGNIRRFLSIQLEDYIVTTSPNPGAYLVGKVISGYQFGVIPGANLPHQIKVQWQKSQILRSDLSVRCRNSLGSSHTVFDVTAWMSELGLSSVGPRAEPVVTTAKPDAFEAVRKRLQDLSPDEFEIFVTCLLQALGFEAEHVGKVGDGGIDAVGTLDIYGFAKVRLQVQAKQLANDRCVEKDEVIKYRGSKAKDAQMAIISTSDFSRKAKEEAAHKDRELIGTINGRQLAEILSERWEDFIEALENYDAPPKVVDSIRKKLNFQRVLWPA